MDATEQKEQLEAFDIEAKESPHKSFWTRLSTKAARIKWSNVLLLMGLHVLMVLGGIYLFILIHPIKWYTLIFAYISGAATGLGLSLGGHRLWAHRSFKVRLPFKLLLLALNTAAMNGSALSYARDHRTHHKHTDTDRDPKNPSRGLVYAHIGWWMFRKEQCVKDAGAKLDFSDLWGDWWLRQQHRFYIPLFLLFGVAIPWAIPVFCWDEKPEVALIIAVIFRILAVLHLFFCVNSVAHFFGARPYDYRIRPTENRLVSYMTQGEGNHNYHHTFPVEWSSSGAPLWEFYNPGSAFLLGAKALGQVYDLKQTSPSLVEATIAGRGQPAYFDPKRGLCYRVSMGAVDWTLGTAFQLWPVGAIVAWEQIIGKQLLIW